MWAAFNPAGHKQLQPPHTSRPYFQCPLPSTSSTFLASTNPALPSHPTNALPLQPPVQFLSITHPQTHTMPAPSHTSATASPPPPLAPHPYCQAAEVGPLVRAVLRVVERGVGAAWQMEQVEVKNLSSGEPRGAARAEGQGQGLGMGGRGVRGAGKVFIQSPIFIAPSSRRVVQSINPWHLHHTLPVFMVRQCASAH